TPLDNIARIPESPVALDTYPDDGRSITLYWSLSEDDPISNASGPADIIWYNISMNDTGQGAGGSKHVIISLGPGNSSFKVENLINNVPYYFIITSVDDVYNMGNSSEVFDTPTDDLVGSPINLKALPSGWSNVSSFNLQWTNPIDNSSIVEAYYKLDNAPTFNNDFTGNDTGLEINSLLLTDPLSEGLHRVYVWLRDGENNRDYTNAKYVNIFYDGTAPASPSGLTGVPGSWSGTNSFTLVWGNPADVSGIGGVYYSLDGQPTANDDGIYTPGININQLTNLILLGEGVHTVYIWLRDNANNTDYSTNVSVMLYLDTTAPGEPQNLQTIPSSWTNVNSFEVTWTNPTDLSGIVGARYKIDVFPSGDTDGTYVAGIDITRIQDIRV
ncbi:MAG: fibronectin type III domain-containing protein, partial [Thermoplasmata archaeon]|nr:fibronectin type III domain-containing protein [Thermoplasmata archaeon]